MRLPPISRHVEDWFAWSREKSQSGVPRALLLSADPGACRRDRGTLDVETVEGDLVEYLSWASILDRVRDRLQTGAVQDRDRIAVDPDDVAALPFAHALVYALARRADDVAQFAL